MRPSSSSQALRGSNFSAWVNLKFELLVTWQWLRLNLKIGWTTSSRHNIAFPYFSLIGIYFLELSNSGGHAPKLLNPKVVELLAHSDYMDRWYDRRASSFIAIHSA